MAYLLRRNGEIVDSMEMEEEMIKALSDPTRRGILEILSDNPSYPSEIADRLGISKQKAYYHFESLENSGLLETDRRVEKSGGVANFYTPVSDAYHLDLGTGGKETGFRPPSRKVENFLGALIRDGRMNGSVVVGSPDEHGPDQVRGRDGHLAGDLCMKLGSYVVSQGINVEWDTDIVRRDDYGRNMLILGGVLTNTVARKFNREFPASFEGEDFPYRRLETPGAEYSRPEIGVVERADNPYDDDKDLVLVAGIRNRGTEAAVRAFKQLEEVLNEGSGYVIVEGRDMDGDGRIDDFEVVEEG